MIDVIKVARPDRQPQAIRLPVWRRQVLLVLLLAGFVVLVGRSVYLQSTQKQFLQQKGDARYSRTLKLPAHRGMITDRNGEPLAISTPVESIWANPPNLEMSKEQVKQLAQLLDLKAEAITKKLENNPREFVYLKRRIAPELARKVMSLKISGIYMQREYRRYYPAGEVAAHIVGFTGVDEIGREGFELAAQDWLSGKEGSRRVIKDRQGRIVEELEAVRVPEDGKDLVLSIDRRVQYLAYRELAKAVERHQAKAGAAIVLDAKSGEVLAMANVPSYNPNNPVNLSGRARNRAIVDLFEPGSTLKPFSAAAALEAGTFDTTSIIDTTPGMMRIGKATVRDVHPQGKITVAQVIQKSSNVGSARLGLSLEPKYLWTIFNQIGFGQSTNIGFPGEAAGRLRDYKNWRPIEQATMSYGYGLNMTLLQLARAYTVFANDGELLPVSLKRLDERPVGQQVFSRKTAQDVLEMMELAVLPGGTAPRAQIMGYRVVGKTGTAHKLGAGGYQSNKYVSSFVGIAPVSNPRLIMAIMVDEPSAGQYYGGAVAAPVFSAVMSGTLRMLAIPQDAPNDNIVIPPEQVPEVQEMV